MNAMLDAQGGDIASIYNSVLVTVDQYLRTQAPPHDRGTVCVLFFASLYFNALFLRGDGQETDGAPQEIGACMRKRAVRE